jgi:hypothetical protein
MGMSSWEAHLATELAVSEWRRPFQRDQKSNQAKGVPQELFERAKSRRPAQAPTHYGQPGTSRSKFRTCSR